MAPTPGSEHDFENWSDSTQSWRGCGRTLLASTAPVCRSGVFRSSDPMSNNARPARAGRPPGWFANRPLAHKFGALIAVVVLAFGLLLAAVLIGNADISSANEELSNLNQAHEVVLQLDTRASELKVDV